MTTQVTVDGGVMTVETHAHGGSAYVAEIVGTHTRAWPVSGWWRAYGYDALRAIARETCGRWGDGSEMSTDQMADAVEHPWRYDLPPEVWATDYDATDVTRIAALRRSCGLLPLL